MKCDRCGTELTKGWLRSKYTGNVYCVNMTKCNARSKLALLVAANQRAIDAGHKVSG